MDETTDETVWTMDIQDALEFDLIWFDFIQQNKYI